MLATHSPTRLNPVNRLNPPSAAHYLGTDEFGRDVYSLVLYGSRVSLLVGGITMVLTSLGGVVIGLVAGYYRRLDLLLMRVTDGLMAFPAIILAIAFMAARGPGVWNVIFALSIVYTPRTALLIRSTVLSVRELDYVQAARALGRPDLGIASRHILPNCMAPLLVQGTFIFAYAVLAEAILGFLGVGRSSLRPVVGQRDRQRQERHPRGLLGEPLSGTGPHAGQPEPEPPRRRPARRPRSAPAGAPALDRAPTPRAQSGPSARNLRMAATARMVWVIRARSIGIA